MANGAGPRAGINWAGYSAWALGFIVGILPMGYIPVPASIQPYTQPAVLYSFLTGLIVYTIVAKLGGQPATVPLQTKTARA